MTCASSLGDCSCLDNGCESCGDCCFDKESTTTALLTSVSYSITPDCQTCLDDLIAWGNLAIAGYDVESGCSWTTTEDDRVLTVLPGSPLWTVTLLSTDCQLTITVPGNCCGSTDETEQVGTWDCTGGNSGDISATVTISVLDNKCCRCDDTCVKTEDESAAECGPESGVNLCVDEQQPPGGCGGVPCNACDPELATTYHVVITSDGTTVPAGVVFDGDIPFVSECCWDDLVGHGLFWTSTEWRPSLGSSSCVGGIGFTGGSTDPCDPTGTYTDIPGVLGYTAVVT